MINKKYNDLSYLINKFRLAKPFPYLILDDFFTNDFFKEISSMTSNTHDFGCITHFSTSVEDNKTIYLNKNMNFVNKILEYLSNDKWLEQLKKLTGINDINTDDLNYSSLSNYHEMNSKGFLGSHVDHSYHDVNKSKHVLNIIIYLSQDWSSSNGGNTLLFNSSGKKVEKKIEYIPNRAIVFLHTPYSFHGVDRIIDDVSVKRKTFYIDYYSNKNNPYEQLSLPFKNHYFSHPTVFVMPKFRDYLNSKNFRYVYPSLNYNIKKFLKNCF